MILVLTIRFYGGCVEFGVWRWGTSGQYWKQRHRSGEVLARSKVVGSDWALNNTQAYKWMPSSDCSRQIYHKCKSGKFPHYWLTFHISWLGLLPAQIRWESAHHISLPTAKQLIKSSVKQRVHPYETCTEYNLPRVRCWHWPWCTYTHILRHWYIII